MAEVARQWEEYRRARWAEHHEQDQERHIAARGDAHIFCCYLVGLEPVLQPDLLGDGGSEGGLAQDRAVPSCSWVRGGMGERFEEFWVRGGTRNALGEVEEGLRGGEGGGGVSSAPSLGFGNAASNSVRERRIWGATHGGGSVAATAGATE